MPDARPVEVPILSTNSDTDPTTPPTQRVNQSPVLRPEETSRKQIKQHELIEGGSTSEEIKLDEKTSRATADVITRRLQVLERIKTDAKTKLSTIDSLILSQGQEIADALKSGNATTEDFLAAQTIIRDEIIQRAVATARLVRDRPGWMNGVKTIPIIGLISDMPEGEISTITFSGSSAYLEELGFSEWDEAKIEKTLLELNDVRRGLELSIFGKGFRDPLFDETSLQLLSPDFDQKRGNRLNDETVKQLRRLIEARHPGENFASLWANNQSEAIILLLEANQRALESSASKAVREIIQSAPIANIGVIEDHAKKLDEPPKREELDPITEEVNEAQEEETRAKNEVERLKTRLSELKIEQATLERSFKKAESVYKGVRPTIIKDINKFQNILDGIDRDITNLIPDPALPPEQEAIRMQNERARLQSERANISSRLSDLVSRRTEIENNYFISQAELNQCTVDIKSLEGSPANPTTTPPTRAQKGSIELAQKEHRKASARLRRTRGEFKIKEEEINNGGSPERKNRAKALRTWEKLADSQNYAKIIDTSINQGFEDEFTITSLSDATVLASGETAGAEKIREHIFRITEGAEYSPEIARQMLSDETIARSIISAFGLDTRAGTKFGLHLQSIDSIRQSISNAEAALAAAQTPANQTALDTANAALKPALNNLLFSALGELKTGSQFKSGDVIRFIIKQGLISAQKGEPYLEIEDRLIRKI